MIEQQPALPGLETTCEVLDRLLAKAEEIKAGPYSCGAKFTRLRRAIEDEQMAVEARGS